MSLAHTDAKVGSGGEPCGPVSDAIRAACRETALTGRRLAFLVDEDNMSDDTCLKVRSGGRAWLVHT